MNAPTLKKIVTLDYMDNFVKYSLNALEGGNAATIFGPEGSGTTTICRYIKSDWMERNKREALYINCCREADHLKSMQHLALMTLRDKMPADWRVYCSSTLMHLITETMRSSRVGLIVIDRADLAPGDFIDSLMTIASNCCDLGDQVGVLLGVRESAAQLSLFKEISSTRVSFVGQIAPLNHEISPTSSNGWHP